MATLHPIVMQRPPSAEQTPAVVTVDRDVALTAGAGTGKTRTLVARVLHLLTLGTPMRRIVAVTFTIKAAREMRNRLRSEIGAYLARPDLAAAEHAHWSSIYADLDAARIGTIHSLCTEILRAHPAEANVDPDFAVLDEPTALQLRGDAVTAALAWATEDEAAVGLFTRFSADGLQALLDALLAERLRATTLLAHKAWEQWATVVADRLATLLGDPELVAAAAQIDEWERSGLLARAHGKGDALAALLIDFPAAWRTVHAQLAQGDSVGALTHLPRLRAAVPGNKGRAASFEGADVKSVTGAVRAVYDRQLKPVVDGTNPTLDGDLAALMPQLQRLFAVAVAGYQAAKAERGGLDFDDLEQAALDLLVTNPTVCARWQAEVDALLVDEFQDTNGRQRDLVRRLNGDRGRLFIVGDAKQSIYRFRGAEVEVFRAERDKIAVTGVAFDLRATHRAHAGLLAPMNGILAAVMGEDPVRDEPWREPFAALAAERTACALGLPAPYVEFHLAGGTKTDGALARAASAAAERIQALVTAAAGALDYGGVAVLCRSSRSFAAYADAFEAAGIPYETVAGRGFLERPEVRDLLNTLTALADPSDDLALYGLLRSPAVGFADTRLHDLRMTGGIASGSLWRALAADADAQAAVSLIRRLNSLAGRVTVAELLKRWIDETGYRAILLAGGDPRAARNVSKLLLDAQRSAIVGVGEFLEYVQRLRSTGSREGEARADSSGAVQIMSIHQAKGLEFPVVVIGDAAGSAGGRGDLLLLDDVLGVVPAFQDEDGRTGLVWTIAREHAARREAAEEDRLLYVAATRARDRLLISGNVSVGKDGRLGARNWLGQLCAAAGITVAPSGFAEEGVRAWPLPLTETGQPLAVAAVLYEANVAWTPAAPAAAGSAATQSAEQPRLLAPLTTAAATGAATETPAQVWRVVPHAAHRWAPAWVVGRLVHAAIAAGRTPDDGDFVTWCAAAVRGHGIVDAARSEDAVRRTRRLLRNFHHHPLHAALQCADAACYEVPFALPGEDGASIGRIDLLMRQGNDWTLVDFKTDRLRDVRARQLFLQDPQLAAQMERYLAAATALLGVRPRALVCLLDDRGAASVEEFGAAPAPVASRSDDDDWTQAAELSPDCAALLIMLRQAGLPPPEVGCDIVSTRGRVVAAAELAWPEQRLALFLAGQESDLLLAGQAGWTTVFATPDDRQTLADVVALWQKENTG